MTLAKKSLIISKICEIWVQKLGKCKIKEGFKIAFTFDYSSAHVWKNNAKLKVFYFPLNNSGY